MTMPLKMRARTRKDNYFMTRMSSELKRKLADAAKREGISMSRYIELLLKRNLEARELT